MRWPPQRQWEPRWEPCGGSLSGRETQVGRPGAEVLPDGFEGGAADAAEAAAHFDAGEDCAVGVDGEGTTTDGAEHRSGRGRGGGAAGVAGECTQGGGKLGGGHALGEGGAALRRGGADAGGNNGIGLEARAERAGEGTGGGELGGIGGQQRHLAGGADAGSVEGPERGDSGGPRARDAGDGVVDGGGGGVKADLDGERVEGGEGGDPAAVGGCGEQRAVSVDAQREMAAAGVGGQGEEVGTQEGLAAGEGDREGAEGGYLVDESERLARREFVAGGDGVVVAGDGKETVAAVLVATVGELIVDAEQPPIPASLGQQVFQGIGGKNRGAGASAAASTGGSAWAMAALTAGTWGTAGTSSTADAAACAEPSAVPDAAAETATGCSADGAASREPPAIAKCGAEREPMQSIAISTGILARFASRRSQFRAKRGGGI